MSELKVWRSIKVGTGLVTPDDFRNNLKQIGCGIDDNVDIMFDDPNFVVSSNEQDVDLGNASVAELGFYADVCYDQICVRIIKLGHQLCEPEDGPQLRLQYLDQPLNKCIQVAMKSLCGSYSSLNIFKVKHNENGLQLFGDCGGPGVIWSVDDRFAFRLCK